MTRYIREYIYDKKTRTFHLKIGPDNYNHKLSEANNLLKMAVMDFADTSIISKNLYEGDVDIVFGEGDSNSRQMRISFEVKVDTSNIVAIADEDYDEQEDALVDTYKKRIEKAGYK